MFPQTLHSGAYAEGAVTYIDSMGSKDDDKDSERGRRRKVVSLCVAVVVVTAVVSVFVVAPALLGLYLGAVIGE